MSDITTEERELILAWHESMQRAFAASIEQFLPARLHAPAIGLWMGVQVGSAVESEGFSEASFAETYTVGFKSTCNREFSIPTPLSDATIRKALLAMPGKQLAKLIHDVVTAKDAAKP